MSAEVQDKQSKVSLACAADLVAVEAGVGSLLSGFSMRTCISGLALVEATASSILHCNGSTSVSVSPSPQRGRCNKEASPNT